MALAEDLAGKLQTLGISDPEFELEHEPEYLLFNPTGDRSWLRETFDDIPRYLFRVFTPKTDGINDRSWVKPKDAERASASSTIDILSMENDQLVASMLNAHLRWNGKNNLVSWTSSLLYALEQIFYRHVYPRDRSSFNEIHLCIIDTTSFPKGVFLRDMDLMKAYSSFDTSKPNLQFLKGLRMNRSDIFQGYFYFGEYLSQGALRIEGNCQIISAQEIIDQGLFTLQPEFCQSAEMNQPLLASEVLRLREAFYEKTAEPQHITTEQLEAAINIAQLFGSRWRLPIAANFIALLPCRSDDEAILRAFREDSFTDDERRECSTLKTRVVGYDTLPEVQQFDIIMQSVYKDYCLTKLEDCLITVEDQLRSTEIYFHDMGLYMQDSTPGPKQDLIVMHTSCNDVLRRFDTIANLSYFMKVAFCATKQDTRLNGEQ